MITPIYKKNLKSHRFVVVGYLDEFGLVDIYLVSNNFLEARHDASEELYLKKGDKYILLTIS